MKKNLIVMIVTFLINQKKILFVVFLMNILSKKKILFDKKTVNKIKIKRRKHFSSNSSLFFC